MAVKNLDPQLVDKRIVKKNLEKKRVSQEEYKAYLASLRDDKENCEAVNLDDDYEEEDDETA